MTYDLQQIIERLREKTNIKRPNEIGKGYIKGINEAIAMLQEIIDKQAAQPKSKLPRTYDTK